MKAVEREIKQVTRGKRRSATAILPSLIDFGEEDMLTLTKRELAVFDEAQPDYAIYVVETEFENSRWWTMKVKVPSQDKTYEVVTALGKTKLWKRLDIAVDFIKETCKRTRTVFVVFST